jgi:hypothetical protein
MTLTEGSKYNSLLSYSYGRIKKREELSTFCHIVKKKTRFRFLAYLPFLAPVSFYKVTNACFLHSQKNKLKKTAMPEIPCPLVLPVCNSGPKYDLCQAVQCISNFKTVHFKEIKRFPSDIGTMLQVERSRVSIPMRSLDFSIYLILPTALCPWGRLSL